MSNDTQQTGLAPEWHAWLAENLSLGVEADSVLATLVSAGVEEALARTAISTALHHPYVLAARRIARRHIKLEALMDVYSELYRQSGEHRRVDRLEKLPPEEFYDRYYYRHRPVVLRGLLDDWPALRRWTPAFFADRFGDVPVEIQANREVDPEYELNASKHQAQVPLREFIQKVLCCGRSNDYYLTARNRLLRHEAFAELLQDIKAPPGYMDPGEDMREHVKLWIGPAGTITPLHHDTTSVMLCQLHGRKRVKLVPSFELHRVYNHRGTYSQVDPDRPDLERHPLFRHASVLEVVIEPGEALFLPVGWWHWVQALEVSVSVTFQHFVAPGGNTLWA